MAFGGGGHTFAAGCTIKANIKESIAQLQEMVAEFEQELELVVRNRKSCKDKYSILSRSADKVITGVRQFAGYIQKSPATAQKILNSNVLQEYGIAYRVGNTWNINVESLVARLDKMGKS